MSANLTEVMKESWLTISCLAYRFDRSDWVVESLSELALWGFAGVTSWGCETQI